MKESKSAKELFDYAKTALESYQFHYWLCFVYGYLEKKMTKENLRELESAIIKIRGKNGKTT